MTTNPLTKPLPQVKHDSHIGQWVLDTFEIGPSASGRVLVMCPRALV